MSKELEKSIRKVITDYENEHSVTVDYVNYPQHKVMGFNRPQQSKMIIDFARRETVKDIHQYQNAHEGY